MMLDNQNSDFTFVQPQKHPYNFGTAFILLALFSGAVGGIMELPMMRPFISQDMITTHAFLMSFFVICPAFLGGISQWLLPKMLKARDHALPSFLASSWCLLALGVIFLPLKTEIGMSFWSLGSLLLAIHAIVNILEERRIPFRQFSPFIWSILFTASSILIIAPLIFALILKNYSLSAFLPVLYIPKILLMIVPALGLISLIFSSHSSLKASPLLWKSAPYLIGTLAIIPPLLWSDYLFGGLPSITPTSFYASLNNFITFIITCNLVIFCASFWSHALPLKITSFWFFVTLISLTTGTLLAPYAFHYHNLSHQLLTFGCLFSLFTGFYSWFEGILLSFKNLFTNFSKIKVYFELWGATHLIITILGIFGSLIFPTIFIVLSFISLSIFGFILMGLFSAHLFLKDALASKITSSTLSKNI